MSDQIGTLSKLHRSSSQLDDQIAYSECVLQAIPTDTMDGLNHLRDACQKMRYLLLTMVRPVIRETMAAYTLPQIGETRPAEGLGLKQSLPRVQVLARPENGRTAMPLRQAKRRIRISIVRAAAALQVGLLVLLNRLQTE